MKTFEPWDNDEPVNYEDLLQRTLKLLYCINPEILSPEFRLALAKCLISSKVPEETIEKVLGVELSTNNILKKVVVEKLYTLECYQKEYRRELNNDQVVILIKAGFQKMGLSGFQDSLLVFSQIHLSLEECLVGFERDVSEDNKSEDANEDNSSPSVRIGMR